MTIFTKVWDWLGLKLRPVDLQLDTLPTVLHMQPGKLTVVHPALVVFAVGGVAVVAAAVGAAHLPFLDQGAADGPLADLEDQASAGLELGVCLLALVLEAVRHPQLAVKHTEEHGVAPAVREVGHGVAPGQGQVVLVQIVEILFLHCLSLCHTRSWCNVSRNYCWKIY